MKLLIEDKVSYSEFKDGLNEKAIFKDVYVLRKEFHNLETYTRMMVESLANGVSTKQ